MKAELIILAGPTAIGKTELSVKLAKKLNAEIISCDSMQIYKYMDIGSAKVTEEEMNGVTHHLIDYVDPKDDYSVAEYKESALDLIDKIHKKGKRILFTGGTGLYIDSIIKDLSFTVCEKNEILRDELETIAKIKGNDELHKMLQNLDYVASQKIHKNNVKRVIRAIEVTKLTGKPFSSFEKEEKLNDQFDIHYYYLNLDREILYKRINERVVKMFNDGLVLEVKKLKEMGLKKEMQSMQGIGYKEVFSYLEGEISLEDCISLVQKNTRNYAKRQLTWFRNDKFCKEIDKSTLNQDEIIKIIENDILNK